MGKSPPEDTRSRTNSIDTKYVDSKPRDDNDELVDTTAPKQPSPPAPLLDRLAEVSELEARSIRQELGPALNKLDLIQRQLVTPSGSLANVNSKDSEESPTEKGSPGKTGDAVDERQPYQVNPPEAKRRPSNMESNRQPASTTPPPTWARAPGVSPYHPSAYGPPHCPSPRLPSSRNLPLPHKYAYPRAPSTIPPPHHRTSPPLGSPPYAAGHPHHVHHHHHHYYPPPPSQYGSRSHHEYHRMYPIHYSRHHPYAPPTYPPPRPVAFSEESVSQSLAGDEDTKLKSERVTASDSQRMEDKNGSKISETMKPGLPPKKRMLVETVQETGQPNSSVESKKHVSGTNIDADLTGELQPQHKMKKRKSEDPSAASNDTLATNSASVEDEPNETKAIDDEVKSDTTATIGTNDNTVKKKSQQIVTPSPRGLVIDELGSSKKNPGSDQPATEEQKRDVVASVTSAELVPSNSNSTKSTPSRLTTPSSSVANTPKAADHKQEIVSSARIHPQPYLSPPPSYYHRPHSWGHRGYPPPPPPSHLRHPMSPSFGKYPSATVHHPPRYSRHPPNYYPYPAYGRPSQDKHHWPPHHHPPYYPPPPSARGYPHHRPVPPPRPFPPRVGSDPSTTGSDPKPLDVTSSTSVAAIAEAKNDEKQTRLLIETGASESQKTDSPSKEKTTDDEIPSRLESQNTGRCMHVWGSMLMTFISKRDGSGGNDSGQTVENPLPPFHQLVNFPEYLPQKSPANVNQTDNENKQKSSSDSFFKNCVMCGIRCHFVGSSNTKRPAQDGNCDASLAVADLTPSAVGSAPSPPNAAINTTMFVIPRQNKGLCTSCDVKVWLVRDLNVTIKWCKGCKNFRHWSAFGEKTRATKCAKCRDRQKEKYAAQKEELKMKRKISAKVGGACSGSEGEDSTQTTLCSNDGGDIAVKERDELSDSRLDAAIGLSKMMNL